MLSKWHDVQNHLQGIPINESLLYSLAQNVPTLKTTRFALYQGNKDDSSASPTLKTQELKNKLFASNHDSTDSSTKA